MARVKEKESLLNYIKTAFSALANDDLEEIATEKELANLHYHASKELEKLEKEVNDPVEKRSTSSSRGGFAKVTENKFNEPVLKKMREMQQERDER